MRVRMSSDIATRPIHDRVAPWITVQYDEQLHRKSVKFTNIIKPIVPPDSHSLEVMAAPKITTFRNNVELTVGFDLSHAPGSSMKQRDNPEARKTLRRYLTEGSKVIKKIDPLMDSTQWNESQHAVKAKYADKRMSFPASTECRFALAVASHLGGPRWSEELRELLDLPPRP
jgi:tRNA/tmRNA/rRNA uracil-C5-methylase (TrmA/RlmC/RlmD family)